MKVVLLLALVGVAMAQKRSDIQRGAPCSIQHSLQPSKKVFGPPKSIEPPFTVTITDEAGNPSEYYEPDTNYYGMAIPS